MTIFSILTLLYICLIKYTNGVEYLQSGITMAIYKDISTKFTNDFFPSFQDQLTNTTFGETGCSMDMDSERLSGASFTIYNFTINEIDFNKEEHIMVLIESSQTIKIVIENSFFNASFKFETNSSVYNDSGDGYFSNDMTITIAMQPSYCNQTGRVKGLFNSIVVQVHDLENHKFVLNAKTFPTMQLEDAIEHWREFVLSNINEYIKIFRNNFTSSFNTMIANLIYETTNTTENPYTPCNLTSDNDMANCPLAVPIRSIFEGFERTEGCFCENLIDYKEKTNNPSIRDNYISTRFYGMTFAPNSTWHKPDLRNSSTLVFMPTYEPSQTDYVIQVFFSEAFLNSIVDTFTDEGDCELPLVNYTGTFLEVAGSYITKEIFTDGKKVKDCKINLSLEKITGFKITAGQLNIENATFAFEFLNPKNNDTIAVLHVNVCMWMSFQIGQNFTLKHIDIGKPYRDYTMIAWATNSTIGNVKNDKVVIDLFSKYTGIMINDDYYIDLYKTLFDHGEKLHYLSPCFNDSLVFLVDRYFSVYLNPDFTKFVEFLQDVAGEEQLKDSKSWFWEVICNGYVPKPKPTSMKSIVIDNISQILDTVVLDNRISPEDLPQESFDIAEWSKTHEPMHIVIG